MKKSYILILIAVIAIFSMSAVSAGFFDGWGGGNVNFLDLSMTFDGAEFNEKEACAYNDNYIVNVYNMTAEKEKRNSIITSNLNDPANLNQESIKNAFGTADSSVSDEVSFVYDKKTDARVCAKTIQSLNEISDYKDINVSGHPASDFIVSDSIVYDTSGSMTPDYLYGNGGKTSNDLARWVFVYDNRTSTLYGIEITSAKHNVLADKNVLKTDEVQSIIDSITLK